MPEDRVTQFPILRAVSQIAGCIAVATLSACASSQHQTAIEETTEYFAESEYGVTASLLMTEERSRLARGGGRDQIGKPYQINGKWYYPKEDPDYVKVGAASWYGDAFHGRLTANGEIYDMTHLTAAHPTMPLPSYARVTNVANGSSVIVRVNDRGPFAHDRIIDLSRRAAELLDYRSAGVAQVEVEYLGRAPLHGRDDEFLLASYTPGASGPPKDITPPVMIAMNGPTPLAGIGRVSFPGQSRGVSAGNPILPAFGPVAPDRPLMDPIAVNVSSSGPPALSYADRRIARAIEALEAFSSKRPNPTQMVAAWKRGEEAVEDGYIAAGAFASRGEAERLARQLEKLGRIELKPARGRNGAWHVLNLHPDGSNSLDAMLLAAWSVGAPEAIAVRN